MSEEPKNQRTKLALATLALALLICGCGREVPPPAPRVVVVKPSQPKPNPKPKPAPTPPAGKPKPAPAAVPSQPPPPKNSDAPAPPIPVRTLENLAKAADEAEFRLPPLDEGKIFAAGIRKIAGKHLTLYTDLPPAADIDDLPAAFDAAVPLWAEYFSVPPAKVAEWRLVGSLIKDKERFVGAGLYSPNLPDFPHGYSTGSQFWLYDQPSGYYRRHLMLHEGTHCFMNRWLGGCGPPWYSEGIAELLGTHRWEGGRLALGIMPRTREELPHWGRVKIVKDELAAGRGLLLPQIMQYDAHAHLRLEPYGWCWAAAAFLDGHPLTQAAFRDLKTQAADRSIDFSQAFVLKLQPHWAEIARDWALFVQECDYGYDFARAAVVQRPAQPLPTGGLTLQVDAARGWQAAGVMVEAGKTYEVSASGRFEVAQQPQPWPCEAGGVTIRYHAGRPLGQLLACVDFAELAAIGAAGKLTPTKSGSLFFKINEAASGLADNKGSLNVTVKLAP